MPLPSSPQARFPDAAGTGPFLALLVALSGGALHGQEPAGPANYVYFGRDRDRIADTAFLRNPGVVGAQLKYAWRELEPERDVYDVDVILRDLEFLAKHGKRLFVQVQDVSFDGGIVTVPRYLVADPAFGGGVARQYGEGDDGALVAEGWVARRWDPQVQDRFVRLLTVLGAALDGRIAGINLPETAVWFGDRPALTPSGYTPAAYRDAVLEYMSAARRAFRTSPVIVYANFMPGEALPERDLGYLRSVYRHAERIGIGVGGPDLLPHRRGQQTHSLPLIAARGTGTVAGLAVQWGNLDDLNPATGEPVTVDELYRYARDQLRLQYLFWGIQEPHYTDAVLPYLRALGRP